MAECCGIWTAFGRPEGRVGGTTHWDVLVHPRQVTAGACVLVARRHVEALPDLTPEEGADLVAASGLLEGAVRVAFAHDKINYSALMMRDPHLHFHVFPRYAAPREVAGHAFEDAGWPGPVDFSVAPPEAAVVAAVRERLRGR